MSNNFCEVCQKKITPKHNDSIKHIFNVNNGKCYFEGCEFSTKWTQIFGKHLVICHGVEKKESEKKEKKISQKSPIVRKNISQKLLEGVVDIQKQLSNGQNTPLELLLQMELENARLLQIIEQQKKEIEELKKKSNVTNILNVLETAYNEAIDKSKEYGENLDMMDEDFNVNLLNEEKGGEICSESCPIAENITEEEQTFV